LEVGKVLGGGLGWVRLRLRLELELELEMGWIDGWGLLLLLLNNLGKGVDGELTRDGMGGGGGGGEEVKRRMNGRIKDNNDEMRIYYAT
jgi:hypothetical protein